MNWVTAERIASFNACICINAELRAACYGVSGRGYRRTKLSCLARDREVHTSRSKLLRLCLLTTTGTGLIQSCADAKEGSGPSAGLSAGSLLDTHDNRHRPSACQRLDPALAAAFTRAVYEAIKRLQVMREEEFQRENFKLRDREYPYYFEANQDRLPRVPDLSDMSGGLSNPTYFNFVSYIAWKTAARHVSTPAARTEFNRAVGESLLQELVPLAQLPSCYSRTGAATPAMSELSCQTRATEFAADVSRLLNYLQRGGYICGSQVVLGEHPGGWSQDWMKEPQVLGDFTSEEEDPIFQVKAWLPADIEGSVALRGEENGFWGRYLSSVITCMAQRAGYSCSTVDEYIYQDNWSGPAGLKERVLLLLGDPLNQVEVPWTPTTLVQDWQLGEAYSG